MTGICVIGLYIAYAIPIYLRLTNPDFQPGPWNLKGYHKLVGWTSLVWIGFITILFFAPLFWPFWPPLGRRQSTRSRGITIYNQNNFNFTGPLILLRVPGDLGLLALLGPQVVHRPEGPGDTRGAAGDRARARRRGRRQGHGARPGRHRAPEPG